MIWTVTWIRKHKQEKMRKAGHARVQTPGNKLKNELIEE